MSIWDRPHRVCSFGLDEKTVSVVKLSRSSELLENRAVVSSVDPCAVKHSLMRDVNCAVGCQLVHFLMCFLARREGACVAQLVMTRG